MYQWDYYYSFIGNMQGNARAAICIRVHFAGFFSFPPIHSHTRIVQLTLFKEAYVRNLTSIPTSTETWSMRLKAIVCIKALAVGILTGTNPTLAAPTRNDKWEPSPALLSGPTHGIDSNPCGITFSDCNPPAEIPVCQCDIGPQCQIICTISLLADAD